MEQTTGGYYTSFEVTDLPNTTYEVTNFTCTTQEATNFTTTEERHTIYQVWRIVINSIQVLTTCFGLLLNILTVISLQRHKENLSAYIRLLLQHQSLLDSWICLMAIAIIFQPTMWETGISTLDLLVCQMWHGQGMYWGCVFLSVYNLLLIAVERYTAVCKPFLHEHMKRRKVYMVYGVMYSLSIVLLIPAYLQTRYTAKGCLSEYYFEGNTMELFMVGYGIFWFILIYAAPCCLFTGLYGRLLYVIRCRKNQHQHVVRIMDKVDSQLTRTLIIVTIFFSLTLGWDSWYYLLGYTGVIDYVFNSVPQIFGVFLSVLNSCLNPVVYLLTMPVFRASVKKTLGDALSCLKQPPSPERQLSLRNVSKLIAGIANPAFILAEPPDEIICQAQTGQNEPNSYADKPSCSTQHEASIRVKAGCIRLNTSITCTQLDNDSTGRHHCHDFVLNQSCEVQHYCNTPECQNNGTLSENYTCQYTFQTDVVVHTISTNACIVPDNCNKVPFFRSQSTMPSSDCNRPKLMTRSYSELYMEDIYLYDNNCS